MPRGKVNNRQGKNQYSPGGRGMKRGGLRIGISPKGRSLVKSMLSTRVGLTPKGQGLVNRVKNFRLPRFSVQKGPTYKRLEQGARTTANTRFTVQKGPTAVRLQKQAQIIQRKRIRINVSYE